MVGGKPRGCVVAIIESLVMAHVGSIPTPEAKALSVALGQQSSGWHLAGKDAHADMM